MCYIIYIFNMCTDCKPHEGRDLCFCLLLQLRDLEWCLAYININSILSEFSQGTLFISKIPWVKCHSILHDNFLSRRIAPSPFPTPAQGLTQQKKQQDNTASRAHVSVLRISTSCFLDLWLPGRGRLGSSWRRRAGQGS